MNCDELLLSDLALSDSLVPDPSALRAILSGYS